MDKYYIKYMQYVITEHYYYYCTCYYYDEMLLLQAYPRSRVK